jgi:hypothetical protein
MVQVTTNPVIKVDVTTVVARLFGLYGRKGGPDYQGIRTTDGKLHGKVICQESSRGAKVRLLRASVLHLTVYNNDNDNNNNNNNMEYFVAIPSTCWPSNTEKSHENYHALTA